MRIIFKWFNFKKIGLNIFWFKILVEFIIVNCERIFKSQVFTLISNLNPISIMYVEMNLRKKLLNNFLNCVLRAKSLKLLGKKLFTRDF